MDLILAEEILDIMEPDPFATFEASAKPPDEGLGAENPLDGELWTSPLDAELGAENPLDEAPDEATTSGNLQTRHQKH